LNLPHLYISSDDHHFLPFDVHLMGIVYSLSIRI
jgi:hypothetical protein